MARDFMTPTIVLGVLAAGWAVPATGAPERAASPAALTATPVDLGTLGGLESRAEAVDGDVVVGSAQTPSGAWHAFMMDLGQPTPTMVDLGTLGGRHSLASDVDGNLVVGVSGSSAGRSHVFVYDLTQPAQGLVDLGIRYSFTYTDGPTVGDGVVAGEVWTGRRTAAFSYDTMGPQPEVVTYGAFGGRDSAAFATGDGVVVGFGKSRDDDRHAFAVDARAAAPRLKALDPDSQFSSANDVADGLVVGSRSARPSAFAYDLNAAKPRLFGLGHLGGGGSSAAAVDGQIVAGSSHVPSGKLHAAAFDLRSGSPEVTDLGTLGGFSRAVEVHGTRVIGYSRTPAHHLHGFVYDLVDSPTITDLGILPGYTWAVPTDSGSGLVVGRVDAPRSRATAWRLALADQPQLRFGRIRYRVEEGAGQVTGVLVRDGDTSQPAAVQVKHAPAARFRARPGEDFQPVTDPVTFEPGRSRATFSLPLLQDDATEAEETIGLQLAAPEGAVLGTPQAAAVFIEVSDLRPDLLVTRPEDTEYLGDDVFNSTGTGQTRRAASPRGGTVPFFVEVCNDPFTPVRDTAWRGDFTLTASPAEPGSRIRYLLGRDRDVTAEMRSQGGFEIGVRPESCRRLHVETRIRAAATVGSLHRGVVSATWAGDGGPRSDVVRTVVRAAD